MADPGLKSYLYAEAERAMQALLDKGVISPPGHAAVLKVLREEQGQQGGYPAQGYPVQNAYQQYYPPQPQGNYQAYQAPSPPVQQPVPQQPPPEKHHSHLDEFGKRMGSNIVNGMSSGFGLTLGSDAANSLWHKL